MNFYRFFIIFGIMNLFKQLFFLIILTSLFTSCIKDTDIYDPVEQFETEKPLIKSYVNSKYPEMIFSDTTGIWFEVVNPGSAGSYEYKIVDTVNYNGQTVKALRLPTVTVKYAGKLITNDIVFDSNQTEAGFTSKLGDLITAWQFAFLPKSVGATSFGGLTAKGLQKGSKIRVVTPSVYAYGNRDYGKIPPNSPLFFEIEVLDIK